MIDGCIFVEMEPTLDEARKELARVHEARLEEILQLLRNPH